MPGILEAAGLQAGYNASVVLAGVVALGAGAGVAGVFPLLRGRAMIADAASHAMLPGVALGFLAATALGADGRSLLVLVPSALAAGALAVLAVQRIRDRTRLSEDAAIASVLAVFFGLGVVLLSHVQTMEAGGRAGLGAFLLGSAATLTAGEALLVGGVSLAVAAATVLFLKEFGAVAFDETFAAVRGQNVAGTDLAATGLLLAVVAVGIKAAGLVLILALVVIPPAAARFWTGRLGPMTAVSGGLGGLAGGLGGAVSAAAADMPTGASIVLAAGGLFALSALLAPAGALARRRGRTR